MLENVLGALPKTARAWFYRTAAGAEIDLVVELNERERWAIEIKRSVSNPAPSKGFHLGCADIGATRQVVIYPGEERFPLDAKTEAMPLTGLVADLSGDLPAALPA